MNDLFYLGVKAVIRDPAGRVLLLKAKDYWDLPGGRLQAGESEAEALSREVTEETGLQMTGLGESLGMSVSGARLPQPDGGQAGLIFSVYECQTASYDVLLSDEHTSYEWVDPATAASRLAGKFSDQQCNSIIKVGKTS